MKAGTASAFGSWSNSASTLTPITVSESAYFFCSEVKCGMALMHGGHQVAQNSTTYTWPASNFVTGAPWIQALGTSAGAGSPILKLSFSVKSPAQEGEMIANQAAMPIGPIKDLRRLLS